MMSGDHRKEDVSAGHDRAQWSLLMARAQSGDQAAYRRLLTEIVPYLRALAARQHRDAADIEDTVQDVLLTVHAVRQTFDPSRPFAPWLAAIASRRIVDRLRRQGRTRRRETSLEPHHETFAAPASNREEATWDAAGLRRAVDGLPAGQRQAITMLKLEEMSLKEASAKSGMSIGSLKVAVHRGVKSLRKLLAPRSDVP